jgi:hypothetical protein
MVEVGEDPEWDWYGQEWERLDQAGNEAAWEGGRCWRSWVRVVKAFIKNLRSTLPNFLGEG